MHHPVRSPFLAAVGFALLSTCSGGESAPRTAEQSYLDSSTPNFAPEEYAARRATLPGFLHNSGGGIFLAPSLAGRSQAGTFRQLDDIQYLSGLELPDLLPAIDSADGTAILFTPDRDPRFENAVRRNDFPGRGLGSDPELGALSGIDDVRSTGLLDDALGAWAAEGLLLDQVAREVTIIQRACEITAAGIRRSAGFVAPDVDERTLEAELEAEFKRRGAQRLAFDSIIKSGPNSLWPWRILAASYDRRNRALQAGLFFGHHTGLDVGDPNVTDEPPAAGMVFTVEPWYDDHERGIAVFTEDMVLVTETGCRMLSEGLPHSPDELEICVSRG